MRQSHQVGLILLLAVLYALASLTWWNSSQVELLSKRVDVLETNQRLAVVDTVYVEYYVADPWSDPESFAEAAPERPWLE